MSALWALALPLAASLQLRGDAPACGRLPTPLSTPSLLNTATNRTGAPDGREEGPGDEEGAGDVGVGTYYDTGVKRCGIQLVEWVPSPPVDDGSFGPSPEAVRSTKLDLSGLQEHFRPKTVVVAGLPRTGSTTLTMLVQIWLMLADPRFTPCRRKGRTIEPYHRKLNQSSVRHKRSRNISSLIKTHKWLPWIRSVADVALASHRSPVEEMISMSLAWNSSKQCGRLMEEQHQLYANATECCGGYTYDMQLEELASKPTRVIEDVARAIGIHPDTLTRDVVDYVQDLLVKHLPSSENQGIKSNQHWHTEDERTHVRSMVESTELADPACRTWNERGGATVQ